ncbi:restriction endonuclease subunit S [Streptomyces sp. NPDC047072]|uniref:restriction endonuclease subunit S n=1 Tax=Streptomyces sp. NPDC047072 TaxID=3154809 RepID=UPI0033ED96BD
MTAEWGAGPGGSADLSGNGLPEGWARVSIGELCEVNPRGFDEEPDDDDLISQVPMAAVEAETGRMDASAQVRYGDLKKKSLTRFQENDVLFAKITPCMENGKIVVARGLTGGRALGSTEFHVLRSRGAVLPEYVMHYLLQRNVRRVAEQHMSGAVGQRRVPRPYLADLEILVPPLAEQHRIVAKLDEQLAHIEAGEAAVEAASAKQQPLVDSMLDRCVLGLKYESGEESLEEIRTQSSRKIDYTSLRALPAGWSWRVARDVCSSIVSGSTPQASLMHADVGDVPFLKVYNISKRGFVDFTVRPTFIDRDTHEQGLKRSRVLPGDVLTNIVGPPLGKTAVVPANHPEWNMNQAIVAFRAGSEISPEWLRFVLQSPYVIGLLVGTARATAGQFNIALSTCRELPIPVPPRSAQDELCKELGAAIEELSRLEESVRGLSGEAVELRRALLHAAFTGTLVPQDPTDEPASALLDRIRAQRAAAEAKPTARRKRTLRKTTQAAAPTTSGRPVPSGTQEALPL